MAVRSGISFANSQWTNEQHVVNRCLKLWESGFPNECSFNALKGNDQQPRTGRALTLKSFLLHLQMGTNGLVKKERWLN